MHSINSYRVLQGCSHVLSTFSHVKDCTNKSVTVNAVWIDFFMLECDSQMSPQITNGAQTLVQDDSVRLRLNEDNCVVQVHTVL